MTPRQWYESTIGKKIDTDNFPSGNPFQCWDYFDFFCRKIGFDGSRYCGSTGYVGDLWMLRDCDGYQYSRDFDYIYDPSQFQTGDWIFWEKHIAFYYDGLEVGQNQPDPWVTAKAMNWNGILGAMRYKHWTQKTIPYMHSFVTINGHSYSIFRNTKEEKMAVLAAGVNKLAGIGQLDSDDILIYGRIMGANYFQMKDDQPDAYGTTYGDLSAPFNGVYQSLTNQDSTLFYDLETGEFGDCTGVEINSTHNVFSPALVFPNSKGHWEYARMVGLSHKDYKSWYTFLIRFPDGYAISIAQQEMTPQEIADDFLTTDMVNIAFLDGGGSAQAAFWYDGAMHYERDTGRLCPSEIVSYRLFHTATPVDLEPEQDAQEQDIPEEIPEEPILEPDEPAEDEPLEDSEDETMKDNNSSGTMEPIQDWQDPENDISLKVRLANLLSVKSLITLSLTGSFIYLVVNNMELPDQFISIYTMCISFFFGYQFRKAESERK